MDELDQISANNDRLGEDKFIIENQKEDELKEQDGLENRMNIINYFGKPQN